jgi:hypothetical protein
MAIADYREESDAAVVQDARDALVDYVVSLEQKLDMAETYGKQGDIRMLALLSDLNTVEEDLAYYAKRAHEPVPMRNYHTEIEKLIRSYLAVILKKETEAIETGLEAAPDDTAPAIARLSELDAIIAFYAELYPDLNLSLWSEKIRTIDSRFR